MAIVNVIGSNQLSDSIGSKTITTGTALQLYQLRVLNGHTYTVQANAALICTNLVQETGSVVSIETNGILEIND